MKNNNILLTKFANNVLKYILFISQTLEIKTIHFFQNNEIYYVGWLNLTY